jgi:hypothetical protein
MFIFARAFTIDLQKKIDYRFNAAWVVLSYIRLVLGALARSGITSFGNPNLNRPQTIVHSNAKTPKPSSRHAIRFE